MTLASHKRGLGCPYRPYARASGLQPNWTRSSRAQIYQGPWCPLPELASGEGVATLIQSRPRAYYKCWPCKPYTGGSKWSIAAIILNLMNPGSMQDVFHPKGRGARGGHDSNIECFHSQQPRLGISTCEEASWNLEKNRLTRERFDSVGSVVSGGGGVAFLWLMMKTCPPSPFSSTDESFRYRLNYCSSNHVDKVHAPMKSWRQLKLDGTCWEWSTLSLWSWITKKKKWYVYLDELDDRSIAKTLRISGFSCSMPSLFKESEPLSFFPPLKLNVLNKCPENAC